VAAASGIAPPIDDLNSPKIEPCVGPALDANTGGDSIEETKSGMPYARPCAIVANERSFAEPDGLWPEDDEDEDDDDDAA